MGIAVNKFLHSVATAISILVIAVALSGCHSSKKAVKGSSGSTYVVPPRIDISDMKRQIDSRNYEVAEINRLIKEAAKWLGVPYKYAGHSTSGTDCSGFVMEVFSSALGTKLPRSSREQQQWCESIERGSLLPGDLVFFATGSDRKRVSHVGLYIGEGAMIHASSSRGVIISNIGERYYDTRFHSAGRVENVGKIYASYNRNNKKKGASPTSEPVCVSSPPQAIATIHIDSLFSTESHPTVITTPAVDIDQIISEKVDSIFIDFFD